MGIKNKFFLNDSLLIDISTGDITLQGLGEYQEKLKMDERLPKIRKILSITRDANVKFSLKEMFLYVEILKKTTSDTNIRWAILTSTPSVTAFASLIELDKLFQNKVLICSTLETATRFLQIQITESDLQSSDFKQF
ncbi:MAG: hypothetical protein ACOYN4_08720 [Bacteroidales bacterium]